MDLGDQDRPDESQEFLIPGKLAKRQHDSRIGRLVIFDDEFDWPAEHAARFVHFFGSELGGLNFVATYSAAGPVSGATMPILSGSALRAQNS